MKSPVHHLRRIHHRVMSLWLKRDYAARVRHLFHRSTLGRIPELTVLAVLILLPFTYSPFNTDPHRFGTTGLLLAGLTILCLSISLLSVMPGHDLASRTGSRLVGRDDKQGWPGMAHLTGMMAPFAALIVFLLLLIFSGNLAIGLNSTLGMVGLALLFLYAVKSTFHVTAAVTSCKRAEQAWVFALGMAFIFWLIFSSPLFTKIDAGLGQTKVFSAVWTQAKILVRPQPLATTTPDYLTSLRVAVGSLVNSPLKGSSLGHYGNAFSMYRGAEFNRSTSWNLPFTHSASTLTDWVTEGGLLGLAIYILLFLPGFLLIFRALKISKIDNLKSIIAKILNPKAYFLNPVSYLWALAVVSLFYSFSLADYVLYLMGLVIIGGDKAVDWQRFFSVIPRSLRRGISPLVGALSRIRERSFATLRMTGTVRLPLSLRSLAMTGKAGLLAMTYGVMSLAMTSGIKALFFLVVPVLALYLFVPIIKADHYLDQSRQVLNTDSAQPAYILLQKAIAADPGNDTYHRAYAQLNLSLANAVGNTDQATAAKLVQQATREIKIAVSLNPESWNNQATEGTLYETLASAGPPTGGDAQTAVGLAESSLLLAAKYNPFDPPTHLNLGGYYFFFKKDLVRAKAEVEKAIRLKDDYADAHYALSVVYRQTGETAKAIEELKIVLTIFPAGSPNYQQVASELQTVEASLKNPPSPSPKTP